MDVSIVLPDDIARRIEAEGGDVPRLALEAFAAEGYRRGVLSHADVGRLLGLPTRWDIDAFLKQAQAYLDYTAEDLDDDMQAVQGASRP